MRIYVCDDNEDMANEWVDGINTAAPDTFDIYKIKDAKKEISKLLARKIAVENRNEPSNIESEFDAIDILVVDYDLVHLDDDGERTTGEGIARLARSYSQCGAIVVMNQFKGPQFDLGMRGHLDSFADVNLDAGLIDIPALWQFVSAKREFNPTTWTPLPVRFKAGRWLSQKLKRAGLDAAIAPLLGLNKDALERLSDTAFGFLSTKAESSSELADVTVRDFLERSLGPDQVEHWVACAEEYLYGFAAFRLIKWLDRAVLRPLEVLIDAAHLIDRLPFLIDDKIDLSDPENWAKAVSKPIELLHWNELKPFHNEKATMVLGKDVFDWFRMVDDERIEELQDEYLELENRPARFHLAEDTSRFVERDKLTSYRADFHNFGDRRAIEEIPGVTYGPLRRIRFG